MFLENQASQKKKPPTRGSTKETVNNQGMAYNQEWNPQSAIANSAEQYQYRMLN